MLCHMTDWKKHGFGPGTDICARCLGAKRPARRRSKWCSVCDGVMAGRGHSVTGGNDDPAKAPPSGRNIRYR